MDIMDIVLGRNSGGGGGNTGGGVLTIGVTLNETMDALVMDKTAGEILTALGAGKLTVGIMQDPEMATKFDLLYVAGTSGGASYGVNCFAYQTGELLPMNFVADAPDDYPVAALG